MVKNHPMTLDAESLKRRLFSKSITQGDCVIWTGGHSNTSGYGLIWAAGRHQSTHRVSYQLHHGAIPPGAVVMHSCDNRLCINPAHLTLGTRTENMQDMYSKQRDYHPAGVEHGMSKLTPSIAEEIRRRYQPYDRQHGSSAMAREFGVSQGAIHSVIRGATWRQ